jgi:hypothetical protein
MEMTQKIVEKLEEIFSRSWGRIEGGQYPICLSEDSNPTIEEVWSLWMNSHDVLIITTDDLLESFADMVNFGSAVKKTVCITNPSDAMEFLLVPKELAERCLVMGELV